MFPCGGIRGCVPVPVPRRIRRNLSGYRNPEVTPNMWVGTAEDGDEIDVASWQHIPNCIDGCVDRPRPVGSVLSLSA